MNRTTVERELIQEIAHFTRKLRAQFDAVVGERGLTLARVRVLNALSAKGSLAQSELAAELEIETPTLVRLLDSMEGQNLISRQVSEKDRRIKHVSLTDEGRALAEEMNVFAADFRADVCRGLEDQELSAALDVLRKLTSGLLDKGQGAGSGTGDDDR